MASKRLKDTIYMECTTNGHSKYYEMIDNGDKTWTAHYGKIGTKGATHIYPMSDWITKEWEKKDKGYLIKTTTPNVKLDDTVKEYLDRVNKLMKMLTRLPITSPRRTTVVVAQKKLQNGDMLTGEEMMTLNSIYRQVKDELGMNQEMENYDDVCKKHCSTRF